MPELTGVWLHGLSGVDVTVAESLSIAAATPLSREELDHVRAATLTNVAAGLGYLGSSASIVSSAHRQFGGSPAGDALALAMQLHARTQDDFVPSGRSHVGAVTLAAALALADTVGDRLLDCLGYGYRSMMSVARTYSAQAQHRRYRPTGFFGPFGSAGVAARALGFGTGDTANAFSLACATTAGTNQSWISGSDEWLLEVGMATRAGVECATLTRAGLRAAHDAFEGEAGWTKAFFEDPHATQLRASLTQPLDVATALAVKLYPVSGIAQPMTHLAVQAHAQLAGRGVRSARVHVSAEEADYPGSMNRGPFSARGQTLMSVAFCVASALADGQVKLHRLDHPTALADLLDRVEVVPDPDLAELDARLTVVADDGSRIDLEGSGRSLLLAGWENLDPTEVAQRSEAPAPEVVRAFKELSQERPDARVLREILLTGVRRD